DHRMPGMDGIETLHAMKQEKDNPNLKTPCIALTANAVHGARELYIGEGFDDYLTKPVNPDKLEAMLIEYLPKDKLTVTKEADDSEERLQRFKNELLDLLPGYSDIDGINTAQAFSRCGDAETLKNAVLSFYEESKEKHEKIKNAAETGNYRDFTILVHALKSSSGLLGATGLSEKAKHLEALGNQENGEEITRLTPGLLADYAALAAALAKYAERDDDVFDPSLPEIPVEELKEAYAAIREFAEADDFDSAGSIVEGLAGYFIPENEQTRYKELKKLIKKFDREGIMRLTES
ncbi:MAG: response regulator, partial [Lachnospiraceae bacterium]|nr:response regulator [Lachnospiraceae bacterium]